LLSSGFPPYNRKAPEWKQFQPQPEQWWRAILRQARGPSLRRFYADVDSFYAYDFPSGTLGHVIGEVIAPRVTRAIGGLFK
jgi:hypothetical protein